jgi:hypothetical protein
MFSDNQIILWLTVIFVTAVAMTVYLSRKIDTREPTTSSTEEVQVSQLHKELGVISGICFGFGFGIGASIALVCVGVLFGGVLVSIFGSLMSV